LTEILVGDVESMALPWEVGSFDVLIMSEVLEHFADPWAVLRKLHPLMKPGALMFCSSPNVSHYRVIKMLWRGDWRLEESGVMDRTHLRWFTPKTYAALLESCGFCVERVEPVQALKPSQKLRAWLLGGRYYLFIKQIKVRAHC
jgi:2-polyprenyl-3-methyl-5-hydroxy-6-metoxy-1,4-benzoquinol methylase